VIDHYRKINSKKGQAEVRMSFYDSGENEGSWIEERVPQSWQSQTEKNIENDELKSQIDVCIDKLPEKYAIVFRMKTINGFETEDICKELQITPSNLWVMIHRARTQLRGYNEASFFEKIKLNLHIVTCKICAMYSKQNKILTKTYNYKANDCSLQKIELSDADKEKLKQELNEKFK